MNMFPQNFWTSMNQHILKEYCSHIKCLTRTNYYSLLHKYCQEKVYFLLSKIRRCREADRWKFLNDPLGNLKDLMPKI